MSLPELQYSRIADLECAWVAAGEGRPLVLLHGWGASLQLMWPLAERMATGGFRVYVPDFPGFGNSERPKRPWSLREYSNFVLEFLKVQKLDRVDLAGHSFGGRVCLMLGTDHPNRIGKMLLFNAAGLRQPQPLHGRARLKAYQVLRSSMRRVGLTRTEVRLAQWYRQRFASPDYRAAESVMRPTFLRIVNEDMRPFAARVQPPTLLFWGDQDEETPLWMGRELEKLIPDAGLIVWEGAGHYSYLDRLADTTRVALHFLRDEAAQ
ncbi:MAG: alpha/beta hydrolase [Anaerolineaceae bacterium]|nr:alpha/beta hydrolase [Anaerolineaceae bacterium]